MKAKGELYIEYIIFKILVSLAGRVQSAGRRLETSVINNKLFI